MKYLFFYRRATLEKHFRDDLSARKSAEFDGDVTRVETPSGRVVWRKVDVPKNLQGDISGWLERRK